MHEPKQYTNRL